MVTNCLPAWCLAYKDRIPEVNKSVSQVRNELPHDKTNKMTCALSEDSDQPGHLPSLIRVFAVCMKNVWVLSYPLSHSEESDQTNKQTLILFFTLDCQIQIPMGLEVKISVFLPSFRKISKRYGSSHRNIFSLSKKSQLCKVVIQCI